MFGLCLASLKKAKQDKLWSSVLQCAKLLEEPGKTFHFDIEGRRKAPPWEIAIVTEEAR